MLYFGRFDFPSMWLVLARHMLSCLGDFPFTRSIDVYTLYSYRLFLTCILGFFLDVFLSVILALSLTLFLLVSRRFSLYLFFLELLRCVSRCNILNILVKAFLLTLL